MRRRALKAAGGNCFTLAILDDGSVFSFGFNDDGALGVNHRAHQATPARMLLPQCVLRLALNCTATRMQTACVQSCCSYCFPERPAALADASSEHHGVATNCLPASPLCSPRRGFCAVDIACGQQHSLIVGSDGSVFASGSNVFGQLGMAMPDAPPADFGDDAGASSSGSGASGSGQGAGGSGTSWTANWARLVAAKKRPNAAKTPVRVAVPESAQSAACGAFHSVVLARSGHVWIFGHSGCARTDCGQLFC